jgi:hypothetical protein
MRMKAMMSGLVVMVLGSVAFGDLEPWQDYEMSDSVWSLTTVKVNPNMGDAYLEGIKQTWAASNAVAKELGQIEDYWIFRSDLPQSGDFNLLLVIKFADTADLAPNKEEYDRFIEAWGRANADASTDYAQKNYPSMREITGEYQLREITLK